jgi:hypothetical protein
MHEDFARGRANQGQTFAGMDAETAAKKAQIEKDRQAQIDIAGGDLNRRNAERDKRRQAAQLDVDRARAEWDAAKKTAQDQAKKSGGVGSKFNFTEKLAGIDLAVATGGVKSSTRGTFSASAVAGLGVDRVQERIAKAAEKTFKILGPQTTLLKEISNKLELSP